MSYKFFHEELSAHTMAGHSPSFAKCVPRPKWERFLPQSSAIPAPILSEEDAIWTELLFGPSYYVYVARRLWVASVGRAEGEKRHGDRATAHRAGGARGGDAPG